MFLSRRAEKSRCVTAKDAQETRKTYGGEKKMATFAFRKGKGTGAETCPAMVSGIVTRDARSSVSLPL